MPLQDRIWKEMDGSSFQKKGSYRSIATNVWYAQMGEGKYLGSMVVYNALHFPSCLENCVYIPTIYQACVYPF